ncbi:MAG: hypothetical protein WCY15_04395 [Phenylobacterium sp.]|uniref:COG3650 family protein n=1 Tax=Phenylobacterium sp. TaxID=1871053 RepID=UPI00355F5E7C
MRAALLALAALTLAACGRPAPEPVTQPGPAPAPTAETPQVPAGLTGGVEGRGTEPFWAVTVKDGRLTLERPDHPPLTAAVGPARLQDGAVVWDTPAVNPPIRVAAREAPGCSDGMSDLSYPLAVELTLDGETLKGCGARAGEMPRGER